MPHEGFLRFIGGLTPTGLRAVDAACDVLLPALSDVSDPRAKLIVEGLQLACRARVLRKKRSK